MPQNRAFNKHEHRRIFVQYGMKRSGNHAISYWLLSKLNCRYYNNILPARKLIEHAGELPDVSSFDDWLSARNIGFRIAQRFGLGAIHSRNVFASIEDLPVSTAAFRGGEGQVQDIVVLRSAENMFSSRIRRAFKSDHVAYPRVLNAVLNYTIDTWQEHATLFLDPCRRASNTTAIFFDAWVADAGYRNAVAARLGVPSGDETLKTIGPEGGGSSFSNTEYDGKADEMEVLNRAKSLSPQERSLYDEIFLDPRLTDLAAKVRDVDPLHHL